MKVPEGRREGSLRAEARIRLQLCRDAVRIASHRGGEGYKAGREARVALHGLVPEAPLPQGSRPPCLGEPRGPQARIQQRTMEQLADVVPMVQILDIPVQDLAR